MRKIKINVVTEPCSHPVDGCPRKEKEGTRKLKSRIQSVPGRRKEGRCSNAVSTRNLPRIKIKLDQPTNRGHSKSPHIFYGTEADLK